MIYQIFIKAHLISRTIMGPTKENNNISYHLVNSIARNDSLLKNINMWILYTMLVVFCKDSHHIDGYNDFFGNFKIVLHVFNLYHAGFFFTKFNASFIKIRKYCRKNTANLKYRCIKYYLKHELFHEIIFIWVYANVNNDPFINLIVNSMQQLSKYIV